MERVATSHPILTEGANITTTIARYWDKVTDHYDFFLGHHIHFGYVEEGQKPSLDEATDHMVEKLVEFGGLTPGQRILDCGCGMGATSILLAQRWGARVSGVTLSPRQVEIARRNAARAGETNVDFQVDDAHRLDAFADGTFDVLWSVESCEQYYDKPLFLRQAFRVLRPGGKLIMATWCSSREEYVGEQAREYQEFCKTLDCPYMPTIPTYIRMIRDCGFVDVRGEDWSDPVNRTWFLPPRISSLRSVIGGLFRSNLRFLRFFFGDVRRLRKGFLDGMVRYGVFTARKPLSRNDTEKA